ncbi:GNAT family N-acetyltransferase [Bacteroidia bacterium]|nr:GNAT family N-acetyltransferase [Bacteroidia bacterium]MDB9881691.1 GNAT family N-acetyltransferase [Bacteroidia bacterium]
MEHTVNWTIKHFKDITALEYHHILALRTDIFVVEQDCPYQEVDYKDLHSYHLWGTIDDKIVAVIRIVEPGTSYQEISIGRVAVAMEYRGTNVGNDLMTASIDFIDNKLGKQSIRISAQEHLKSFYTRFNFEQVSEMYLEDDIPHIEMLRILED